MEQCKLYKDGICASPINKKSKQCNEIPMCDCYYKQKIVLEEENKKLKEELNLVKHKNNADLNRIESVINILKISLEDDTFNTKSL